MKICPECKDVIMYCKCAEQDFDIQQKEKLDELLKYVQRNGRIHPKTAKWFEMYSKILTRPELIEKDEDGNIINVKYNKKPNIPPIKIMGIYLARMLVLDKHIKYAYNIGKIDELNEFLRGLSENEWFKG